MSSSTFGTPTWLLKLTESSTLDKEQTAASSIAPESRQIVLAPPGSGKTEVVAALLEHFTEEGLDSFGEVMAISFSRAAVRALKGRIDRGNGRPRVAIRTLDSLASRLLDELDEQDWLSLTFDRRIDRAVQLIEAGGDASDIAELRHLIVDEVQDLVGDRARLVLAILARLPAHAGFTLLGDPHQAVYDFQLQNEDDMTSATFLGHARKLGSVEEVRLDGQYRARSDETRAAIATLRNVKMGDDRIRTLRSFVSSIFLAGDVAELARPVRGWTGTTAFLCRTNGQAMVVAERLREAGLPATTRGPADALPLAGWIAETFSNVSSTVVTKADALTLLAEGAPITASSAWRLLKDVERDFRSPERLDLRRLGSGLARGLGSADLLAAAGTDVVVSTIHRAKGLEFDNVVLVNPSDLLSGTATDEDASVAYVAITRARDQLMAARCAPPDFLRVDQRSGRWFVGGYKTWMTRGFELRGPDSQSPSGAIFGKRAAEYVGRAVVGRVDRVASTLDFPIYSLFSDDALVATTTEDFGRILAARFRGPSQTKNPWPWLTGLAVESVETLISSDSTGDTPTFRLGLRIAGLAMLNWGDEESR